MSYHIGIENRPLLEQQNMIASLDCTYPELSSKHSHFSFNLFLPEAPLYGIQAILHGQGNVTSTYCWSHCTSKDVWLTVEADAHSIGIHHSQGTIITELIAVPHLIWSNNWGGGEIDFAA